MLFTPFAFQNGKTAKNRIFKSAMEEQLAQNDQPSEKLVRLYGTWAQGGAGVLVTGNVMVAESGKGSAFSGVKEKYGSEKDSYWFVPLS